jgi:hypothetical protein
MSDEHNRRDPTSPRHVLRPPEPGHATDRVDVRRPRAPREAWASLPPEQQRAYDRLSETQKVSAELIREVVVHDASEVARETARKQAATAKVVSGVATSLIVAVVVGLLSLWRDSAVLERADAVTDAKIERMQERIDRLEERVDRCTRQER